MNTKELQTMKKLAEDLDDREMLAQVEKQLKYFKDKRKAFEVEDIDIRKNYSFVLDGNKVYMYDTSRGLGNKLLTTMPDDSRDYGRFPFECKNAKEYYELMLQKAVEGENGYNIFFIGYVDPETFEPIEEDE